jgi:O-succinylbenzoic acid--CoA ligase
MVIVPTSGTTDKPKLVALDHHAVVASAFASEANLGWESEDRWLLNLPLAHVGGLSILTRCLLAGKAVVLPGDARFDAGGALDVVAASKVTLLSMVPTMLHRVLAMGPMPKECARVRAVLLGGAPAAATLLARAHDAGWPVLPTYGLTEACSQVATQPYGTRAWGESGVGCPLPGIEVRIDQGDVQVRGATIMKGYLGEPSPFLPGGWFSTGDLGHFDGQGTLHVRGRRADTINTGGENVAPAEVESQLASCPGVDAVCVFGIDDDAWGQVVAAAFVGSATEDSFARYASGNVAGFKRPRWIAKLETFPVTGSGKVDRRAVVQDGIGRLRKV